jgi:hypothetical protein
VCMLDGVDVVYRVLCNAICSKVAHAQSASACCSVL